MKPEAIIAKTQDIQKALGTGSPAKIGPILELFLRVLELRFISIWNRTMRNIALAGARVGRAAKAVGRPFRLFIQKWVPIYTGRLKRVMRAHRQQMRVSIVGAFQRLHRFMQASQRHLRVNAGMLFKHLKPKRIMTKVRDTGSRSVSNTPEINKFYPPRQPQLYELKIDTRKRYLTGAEVVQSTERGIA